MVSRSCGLARRGAMIARPLGNWSSGARSVTLAP
jgi:hypothetical protein